MTAAVLATKAALSRKGERILPQYNSLPHKRWWKALTIVFAAVALVLVVYTGFLVALGGTLALRFVGFPIGVMALLTLWMLPDVDKPDNPPFWKLLSIYMFMMVAWPTYVAIAIPGLPWVTPPRLVLAVMLIIMLTHFPQVAEARRKVMAVVGHDVWAFRLYLVYMVMEVIVLPLSPAPLDAVSYEVMQGVLDLSAMIVAAWLFADIRNVPKLMRILVLGAIVTMLVTIVENLMQRPPWMGYIPSLFRIDSELIESYLSPQARVGDNRYRVRATFGVVLYYSQYLGIILPPMLYQMWRMPGWRRALAVLMLPLILQTVWYCNARTAFVALFVSLFGYGGLVLTRQIFFRRRGDGLQSGILVAVILLAIVGLAGAIASSHRLQMYTFGGSQHVGSNEVRDLQWRNALRAVARNPIGVGMGVQLPDVGIVSSRGIAVIDSFYINLLVGVGPIGFIAFMGCMLRVAWLGLMTFMRAEDELEEWGGALALSVINFVIAAYVISYSDNNYLVFTFLVGILALHRHQQLRLAAAGRIPKEALPSPATALARR
ncbi:MAG: hypothetical protein WCO11_07185 [Sphingomonadales bacterium]|jgi:hypothetical protein